MSSTSGSFFEFLDKKFEQAEYGDRNAQRPTHPESSDPGVIDQMTVARTSNGYHDVTSLYLYPEGIHIVRSERNGNSRVALDDEISFSELDSFIRKAREALARYKEHSGTRKATTKANNTAGEHMAQANNSASN